MEALPKSTGPSVEFSHTIDDAQEAFESCGRSVAKFNSRYTVGSEGELRAKSWGEWVWDSVSWNPFRESDDTQCAIDLANKIIASVEDHTPASETECVEDLRKIQLAKAIAKGAGICKNAEVNRLRSDTLSRCDAHSYHVLKASLEIEERPLVDLQADYSTLQHETQRLQSSLEQLEQTQSELLSLQDDALSKRPDLQSTKDKLQSDLTRAKQDADAAYGDAMQQVAPGASLENKDQIHAEMHGSTTSGEGVIITTGSSTLQPEAVDQTQGDTLSSEDIHDLLSLDLAIAMPSEGTMQEKMIQTEEQYQQLGKVAHLLQQATKQMEAENTVLRKENAALAVEMTGLQSENESLQRAIDLANQDAAIALDCAKQMLAEMEIKASGPPTTEFEKTLLSVEADMQAHAKEQAELKAKQAEHKARRAEKRKALEAEKNALLAKYKTSLGG